MAQDEREMALRFRFETARQDIQRAKADFSAISTEVNKLKAQSGTAQGAMSALKREAATIGRERHIDKIANDFKALSPEIRRSKEEADKLAASLAKIGATEGEIRRVARAVAETDSGGGSFGLLGGTRSGNKIQKFGRELRALPAVQLPGLGFSSDVVGKVLGTVGALGPAGVAATAAVGALVIAIGNQVEATKKVTEATKEQIAAQTEARDIILRGTTDEIKLAREKALIDREVAFGLLQRAASDLDAAKANANYANGLDEVRKNLGLAFGELPAYEEALDTQNKAYQAAENKLREFDLALQSGAAATRDAALAEAELSEARIEAAKEALKELNRLLDASVNAELRARLAADSFTEQQAQERIAAAKREQQIIRGILQEGGGSEENVKRLTEQLQDLGTEILTLTDELPKLRFRDSINDAITSLHEQAEATKALNEEVKKIDASLAEKAADLGRDRDKAIDKAKDDAAKAELVAFKKKQDELAKLDEESAEERIKINADFRNAEKKALRDFNRDSSTAIAERDVLAFVQAEQRKNDELEAAKEARSEALSELNNDLKKQRAAIEKAYNDQLTVIADRLNEQTRIAFERYNEQLAQAQIAAQRQREIEQKKYADQIAIAQQGSAAAVAVFGNMMGSIVQIARNGLSAFGSQQSGLFQTIANLFAGKSLLPKFDTGGLVTKSGLAFVDKQEMILNPRQQSKMGGLTFAPTINGVSRAQIHQEVTSKLNFFLDEGGWGAA